MFWSAWPRVVLRISPIDAFEEADWLDKQGATYKWTTGNIGSQIFTAFYIKDPAVAILFKLTHYQCATG
jgi:hypothetical protein